MSDAYSFSKQVTEDISAYFARREGIANACLRFGVGLATLPDLRQRHGGEFRDARTLVDWRRAQRLLSFESQIPATRVLET